MLFKRLLQSGKPQIDLVIPGLFDLPLYELDTQDLQRRTPALHRLLRFATRIENRCFDIDEILADTLALTQKVPPYAQALKGSESGSAVLFKPVHLKADINNALVFPVHETQENITWLINDLQDYFKVDFSIHALNDELFLMHLHQLQPVLEVPHYLSATGKKVTHYLEQAKSNLQWFKLFNEIQMFLFQHPLNMLRQQQGLPEINSLWCWGGDSWQGESFPQLAWFSENIEMQALGRLYSNESTGLDQLANSDIARDTLVVDLRLMHCLKGQVERDLLQLLQDIEQQYLASLMQNDSAIIRLRAGAAFDLRFTRAMTRKFWKKSVQLSHLSG